MKTSPNGINLLCTFEGFRANPYLCSANVATIGFGSTDYNNGLKVTLNDPPIKKEHALELLRTDLIRIENKLNALQTKFNQNQFDALISFFYNLGDGKISNTHTSIGLALKNGDHTQIASTLLIYCKANGVTIDGLRKRREIERDLYNSPC
jgi:lysozyme